MLKKLVKNRLMIFYRRLRKDFGWKEIILLLGIILLIGLVIEKLIFSLFLKTIVSLHYLKKLFILSLCLSMVILLMTIPNQIYKQLVQDKKIDILMIAPITLDICFGYELIVSLFKILIVSNGIMIIPLLVGKKIFEINILMFIFFNIFFDATVLLIIYLLFMVFFNIFKRNNIKKIILIFTGIIDVLFTVFIMLSLNYLNINQIINDIEYIPLIRYLYLFFIGIEKNRPIQLFGFLIWIILLIVLYKLVFIIFAKTYEETGFKENVNSGIHIMRCKQNYLNCFLWKDSIIIKRNFGIVKEAFLSILLWTISTIFAISGMTEVNTYFINILALLMGICIIFQISNFLVKQELTKLDIIYISDFTPLNIWRQKVKFISFLISIIVMMYTIIIHILKKVEVNNYYIFILIMFSCLWVTMAYVSMIMFYHYDNSNSLQNKLIRLCIKSVVFTLIYFLALIVVILAIDNKLSEDIYKKYSIIGGVIIGTTLIFDYLSRNVLKQINLERG